MKRYNNDKAPWGAPRLDAYPTNRFGGGQPQGGRRKGANRPDTFPNGTSRRDNAIGRHDNVGLPRHSADDGDRDHRPGDDANHDDSVGYKLDRLIDHFDKSDNWRDDIDLRFENLEPAWPLGNDQPYDNENIDDLGFDDQRQRRTGDRGFRSRNPNFGERDSPQRDRYRREGRNRRGACWDPPGYQQHRHQIGGYDQQFNRPATCYDPPQSRQPSCWEPPPRRASREYSDYDKPPLGPPSRWDPPDYRYPQTL